MKPSLTIGIEEEYQTIDPETRDLRSHIGLEMIEKGKAVLTERVKPEMHQSVIEAGTRVCANIQEAKDEIYMIRRSLIDLANQHGSAPGGRPPRTPSPTGASRKSTPTSATTPSWKTCRWWRAPISSSACTCTSASKIRETAIHIMNAARYFLPHILALSTNSPFWRGMDTGLKSYRCKVFDKFPRTNIPDYFPSYGEYESFINLLVKTNCIDNAKKIWWDIRPHPYFNTLEFRMCDIPMRARGDHRARRADPGHRGQALQAALQEPGLPAVPPRADHGEQVARPALRHRRQADRFRQAHGSACCAT